MRLHRLPSIARSASARRAPHARALSELKTARVLNGALPRQLHITCACRLDRLHNARIGQAVLQNALTGTVNLGHSRRRQNKRF